MVAFNRNPWPQSPESAFLTATSKAQVRGRLNGVKNRVSEFVRTIVDDRRIGQITLGDTDLSHCAAVMGWIKSYAG